MAINVTGLTNGLVRKLNAFRKYVGNNLAEGVFAKWLERQATSRAKDNPEPVAMRIIKILPSFENSPQFISATMVTHYIASKARARRTPSHTRIERRNKRSPLSSMYDRLACCYG